MTPADLLLVASPPLSKGMDSGTSPGLESPDFDAVESANAFLTVNRTYYAPGLSRPATTRKLEKRDILSLLRN
jgi:hypothetical protein